MFQTLSAKEALYADVAGQHGLDKETWPVRIAWTQNNHQTLETLQATAEEPAKYYAAVKALRTVEDDKATAYGVSLDATASGIQILAALSGCAKSASICNLIDTGQREDAYNVIYKAMCDATGEAGRIDRKDHKKATMTAFYCSTAQPKRVFGDGALLETFYKTLKATAPGAWQLNQVLEQWWQPYAKSHDWVLPDNFHVHIPVESMESSTANFMGGLVTVDRKVNKGTKTSRSLPANIVHSIDGMIVREMYARCSYDTHKIEFLRDVLNSGTPLGKGENGHDDMMVKRLAALAGQSHFLSTRILDHADPWNMGHLPRAMWQNLLDSMPERRFDIITVHDCFVVHPNYATDLRRQYNEIMAQIAESKLLQFLGRQITGEPVTINKMGNLGPQIREANYALS